MNRPQGRAAGTLEQMRELVRSQDIDTNIEALSRLEARFPLSHPERIAYAVLAAHVVDRAALAPNLALEASREHRLGEYAHQERLWESLGM